MRQMNGMPASVRPALRRLARRLAIGLFLDVWPTWAVASLLLAGLVALVCRMFLPAAASSLHWLWLAPVLTAIPALVICLRRAYRPGEVVAMADWLNGGQGMLLTLLETNDPAWAESPLAGARLEVPAPAAASMAQAGRAAAGGGVPGHRVVAAAAGASQERTRVLADDIAANLKATVAELKQQELITPDEEKKLEEEIERIRRGAEERVDASSWEAADALREKVVGGRVREAECPEVGRGESGSLRRRGQGRRRTPSAVSRGAGRPN